jgi:hypothetical protein
MNIMESNEIGFKYDLQNLILFTHVFSASFQYFCLFLRHLLEYSQLISESSSFFEFKILLIEM